MWLLFEDSTDRELLADPLVIFVRVYLGDLPTDNIFPVKILEGDFIAYENLAFIVKIREGSILQFVGKQVEER